jgi:hypothetical protein
MRSFTACWKKFPVLIQNVHKDVTCQIIFKVLSKVSPLNSEHKGTVKESKLPLGDKGPGKENQPPKNPRENPMPC